MNIGRLAAASGTAVETIRWYERIGLLPTAARTAGNYRIYGAAELDRLRFIRHCRMLDMAIDEIRALLQALDHPANNGDCTAINALLDQHLGHVEARIAELQQLRTQLQTLRQQCTTPGQLDRCGILAALSSNARSTAAVPGEPTTAAAAPAQAQPHVRRTHGIRQQRREPAPQADRRTRPRPERSER